MVTGYSARTMATRNTLPNGTILTSQYYGPPVDSTYPSGSFIEDYAWSASNGDLDACNGRWCVTPEYPSGTYAYFLTVDSTFTPVYPFILGQCYYGKQVLPNGKNVNMPSSGLTSYFTSNSNLIQSNKIIFSFLIIFFLFFIKSYFVEAL
jgi:hypothetical protein